MNNEKIKILYLDCSRGASGDMLLAAMLDSGLDFAAWRAAIGTLALDPFPQLVFGDAVRGGIKTKTFQVIEAVDNGPMRTLADMERALENSRLPAPVAEKTAAALGRLAACEAAIHGKSPENIHFHELSGADTIIDVAGVFLAVHILGVERVVCSPVNVGSGKIECAHGVFAVPAPATAKLLEGATIFARGEGEFTTPTGALLVTELADEFGEMPEMKLNTVGSGAGTREYAEPCILRAYTGEGRREKTCRHGGGNSVFIISTNIDDMEPRIAGYVMERLLEAGALDVYIEPAYMKKNRPAMVINVLGEADTLERLTDVMMRETTTLGVRVQQVRRVCMERRMEEIVTPDGPVRVKTGVWKGETIRINPEYDDCARIARETGRPLADVMDEVKREAIKKFKK